MILENVLELLKQSGLFFYFGSLTDILSKLVLIYTFQAFFTFSVFYIQFSKFNKSALLSFIRQLEFK